MAHPFFFRGARNYKRVSMGIGNCRNAVRHPANIVGTGVPDCPFVHRGWRVIRE